VNEKVLTWIYFVTALGVCVLLFPDGPAASLLGIVTALAIGASLWFGTRSTDVMSLFLVALIARTAVSAAITFFGLTDFFALDWIFYDKAGADLAKYWMANGPLTDLLRTRVIVYAGTAWGMSYFVGAIYSIVGRNLLAAQLVIAAIGSATAPVTYLCANQIFKNRRVAITAGYVAALMPSLVLWSSLVLKDGIIISLLIIAIYCAIKLQEKMSVLGVVVLVLSLIGILSMRYYIFYLVSIAILGGFVAGQRNTARSILARSVTIIIVGVSLSYLGFLSNASRQIETMTTLQNIQISRLDLAQSAASGYGEDIDVSTTGGAIRTLPLGFTYLMLAPFPWQITSTLALLTLPEMLVWWTMIPFLVIGIRYSLKNRLREALPMMIFTVMLTIGYSILQGNVGTAYRQRAQIQIFLFIFIAVGWTIWRERREDREMLRRARLRMSS